MNTTLLTPEEIIQRGEQLYLQEKDKLEKDHNGEFAVVDVETGDFIINQDKTAAIQEAEKKHPNKLFFIVQIGNFKSKPQVEELHKYGLFI